MSGREALETAQSLTSEEAVSAYVAQTVILGDPDATEQAFCVAAFSHELSDGLIPVGSERAARGKVHDCRVALAFDPEVSKWYVADTDIPGLILEDSNPARLLYRLRLAARSLLELASDRHQLPSGMSAGDSVRLRPALTCAPT